MSNQRKVRIYDTSSLKILQTRMNNTDLFCLKLDFSELNYLNGCLFLLAYVTQFSQFEHLMRLDFLRQAYT